MDEGVIVRKFMDADVHITPGALNLLRKREDGELVVEQLLNSLEAMVDKPPVITENLITKILETSAETEVVPPPPIEQPTLESREITAAAQETARAVPELTHLRFKPKAADTEPHIKVLQDITGHSYSEGGLKDFVKLFRDRYDRMNNLLRKRTDLREAVPIGNLKVYEDGARVEVIGMVAEKRETSGGHVLLEVEDQSGRVLSVWLRLHKPHPFSRCCFYVQ